MNSAEGGVLSKGAAAATRTGIIGLGDGTSVAANLSADNGSLRPNCAC
ncbi:unnamed protein product [Protopolystoma xenopodis]|uniref:Uncharacterized protein n=1 Tax=Protopolystoma xenopodis TaxID=117903 RepID=A0A448WHD7_9PLAT|nr:unnamed protein product [Protopolystoma xenopodis]